MCYVCTEEQSSQRDPHKPLQTQIPLKISSYNQFSLKLLVTAHHLPPTPLHSIIPSSKRSIFTARGSRQLYGAETGKGGSQWGETGFYLCVTPSSPTVIHEEDGCPQTQC